MEETETEGNKRQREILRREDFNKKQSSDLKSKWKNPS